MNKLRRLKRKRLKNKILAIGLCAACIGAAGFSMPSFALVADRLHEVLSGRVTIVPMEGVVNIDNDNIFEIKNNPNGDYQLIENININHNDLWTEGGFGGTLDGNGLKIKIDAADNTNLSSGLFGETISGTIKNVIFEMSGNNAQLKSGSGQMSLLGRVLAENGILENIHTTVNLSTWGGNDIYGLVEDMRGNIINCHSGGNIEASSGGSVYGLAGQIKGSIINSTYSGNIKADGGGHAAGIAEKVEGNIINTYNHGYITISGSDARASGIADFVEGTVINSGNYGQINNSGGQSAGIAHTVIGSVKNSFNASSSIKGQTGAAGIVYRVEGGDVIGCYNGSTSSSQDDKVSGLVSVSSYGAYVAGIAGTVNSALIDGVLVGGNVKDSINFQDIGYTQSGGTSGHSAAGIVFSLSGNVENSVNRGNIGGIQRAAGIVIESTGSITNSANHGIILAGNSGAGGIAHTVTNGQINNSHNHGKVTSGGGPTGGIVSTMVGTINDSTNSGYVERGSYGAGSLGAGSMTAGGVAGHMTGYIYNSVSTGDVKVLAYSGYAAGIAGFMYGQIVSNKLDQSRNTVIIVVEGTITAQQANYAAKIAAVLNDSGYVGGSGYIPKKIAGYSFSGTLVPARTLPDN